MSIGHRASLDEIEQAPIETLFSVLGDGDTPRLYAQSYKLDTEHTIAMGGGSSVDRRTVYIDTILYREIMSGKYAETGLTPQQIIERWCDHEHGELTIIYGDNAVDTYQPGHRCALTIEHWGVLAILGRKDSKGKIEQYESVIWPGLLECYHRPVTNPPLDLWCGPHLDQPTPRDLEIIEELRRKGVKDAVLTSKYEAHYGEGARCCVDCSMFAPQEMSREGGKLAACTAVSGLVRDSRWCEFWTAKSKEHGNGSH